MAFAGINLEFFRAPSRNAVVRGTAPGELISNVNDTSVSGTETATVPEGCELVRVYAAADSWVSWGGSIVATRKSFVPSGVVIDLIPPAGVDTIAYTDA